MLSLIIILHSESMVFLVKRRIIIERDPPGLPRFIVFALIEVGLLQLLHALVMRVIVFV